MLTHFYSTPVEDQVLLVDMHIQFHARMGVTRHVLYVKEDIGQLLQHRRVQVGWGGAEVQ